MPARLRVSSSVSQPLIALITMTCQKYVKLSTLFLLFLFLTVSCRRGLVGEETDVSRYKEILHEFGEYQPVAHFPEVIPSDASEIQFFFAPDFLQGGNIFQLRVQLPEKDIEESIVYYRLEAIRSYIGGDMGNHLNLPDGLPSTFFYTQNSNELTLQDDEFRHTFPDTFELFILGAHDASSPEYSWNHGYSYGVAIDKNNRQLVHWYEDW